MSLLPPFLTHPSKKCTDMHHLSYPSSFLQLSPLHPLLFWPTSFPSHPSIPHSLSLTNSFLSRPSIPIMQNNKLFANYFVNPQTPSIPPHFFTFSFNPACYQIRLYTTNFLCMGKSNCCTEKVFSKEGRETFHTKVTGKRLVWHTKHGLWTLETNILSVASATKRLLILGRNCGFEKSNASHLMLQVRADYFNIKTTIFPLTLTKCF